MTAAVAVSGHAQAAIAMPSYDLGNLSVLVIDDSRAMASLVRQMVVALGVSPRNCRVAADGAAGYLALRDYAADLVICNWQMAPLDGLDFLRLLRTAHDSPQPEVPVIVLSAFTERDRVLGARDAGAHEYLAKPVSPRSLYARIVALIERPRPFVRAETFVGPDRRRAPPKDRRRGEVGYGGPERRGADYDGPERRRAEEAA